MRPVGRRFSYTHYAKPAAGGHPIGPMMRGSSLAAWNDQVPQVLPHFRSPNQKRGLAPTIDDRRKALGTCPPRDVVSCLGANARKQAIARIPENAQAITLLV